jgi:uncharacterized membrane protein HdeD (DUF308 family)
MTSGRDKRPEGYAPEWYRIAEVILGLGSVVVAVVALANPGLGFQQLVLLLSVSVLFNGVRMIATGSIKRELMSLEALGLTGGGLSVLVVVVLVVAFPVQSLLAPVFLLAAGLTIQGLGRAVHAAGRGHPAWIRGSALATGAVTVALAGVVLVVQGVALLTLVALLAVLVLVNGLESIVSGLRPTDRRQLTLLKLIFFSTLYGMVLVNWIDLFATSAPAYHVWLILTYMAPFGVLTVFQGFKDWQLAVSLGLLVSLMNDVGYYFSGNLIFGLGRPLIPFLEGQLGFLGSQVLFQFQGGFFTIPVTSTLMGLTIYSRIAVVSLVLYHWWRNPSGLGPSTSGP